MVDVQIVNESQTREFFSGVNAWCPTSVWSSDSSFFILSNTIDFHIVNQPQGCGLAETRPALWRFPTCERLKPKITWRELAPLNIVAFDIVIGRRDRQISLLHQYLSIMHFQLYPIISIIISALKARVWSKQILTKSHVSIWTSSVVRVTRCNTHAMMPRTRRMKHVPTLSRPAMPEKRLLVRSESAKRDDQHKKEKRTTLAARNRLSLFENVSEKVPPLTK